MAPKVAKKAVPATVTKAAAPAEAQKRKADEVVEAAEAPATKEAKVEVPVEQEADAVVDKRAALKGEVGFNTEDLTLNCLPTLGGRLLGSLSEGGLSSLLAGARGNVGMKAGRYLFEVKVLERVSVAGKGAAGKGTAGKGPAGKGTAGKGAATKGTATKGAATKGAATKGTAGKGAGTGVAKATLRIGFSTAEAPLVLAQEFDQQAFFDVDGGFFAGGKHQGRTRKVNREVVAILLNLDPSSPNKNTVSLFCNGVRACQPQPLPEGLHGKVLFPHVTFRGVKVQVNMGSAPLHALPFTCRLLGQAAQADTVARKADTKGGKYEVVLPVGFPGEGTFGWLDGFLAKNPHFTELSDRKIVEWARLSGLNAAKGWKASNDRSELKFGAPGSEDAAVARIIRSVAALVPRNYVVMEVKENLLQQDREAILKSFCAPCFKKIAHVVMGEPAADYHKGQQEIMLKDKQRKSDAKWRAEQADKKRKKEAAKQAKKVAEARAAKLAEVEARKKAVAEKAAAAKAEKDKKADGEKKDGDKMEVDEGKKEDTKEDQKEEVKKGEEVGEEKKEDKKDEKEGEEKKEESKEPEPESEEETEAPKVELTDEEKKVWFAPSPLPDLTPTVLNRFFGKFSIPGTAEGFDDVRFEWQDADGSKAYLQKWVQDRKKSTKVENLVLGEWFRDTSKAFTLKFAEWQAKQKQYKASAASKAAKKTDASAEGDISSVTDVSDVGGGEPLFKDFAIEDWALLQLRFELLAMQDAFQKDVNDADRPGIPEGHVSFYYQKYYKKALVTKPFGVENLHGLLALVKDAVSIEGEMLQKVLSCEGDDFDTLVKQTELYRRERQRRVDAGDETAKLKVAPDVLKPSAGTAGKGHGKK